MDKFTDEVNKVLAKTKCEPSYNGYQYLTVFLITITLSTIVQFFSTRKYEAKTTGAEVIGFLPYFMNLSEVNYIKFNSWLMGCVIAGATSLIILLLSDIILQIRTSYAVSDNEL